LSSPLHVNNYVISVDVGICGSYEFRMIGQKNYLAVFLLVPDDYVS
jgi:hypothetical protein